MNKVPTPFSSRADHVEHLTRIMRDRAYPEFGAAPLPLWAMDAADTILHEFEDLYRASQADSLDVERLREAIERSGFAFDNPDAAHAIAREYAALAKEL